MIASLIIGIVFVLVETTLLPVAGYLIACWWVLATRGMRDAIWVAAVAGIILDILTPRHLGTSSMIALLVIIIFELVLGRGRGKEGQLLGFGVVLVVVEGLSTGRSVWMIGFGIVIMIGLSMVRTVFAAGKRGIVVRREI